jgi:hypothetical protein
MPQWLPVPGVEEERLQTKKAGTTEARSGRSRVVPHGKGFVAKATNVLKMKEKFTPLPL